jgi:hypothetical protein
MRQGKMACWDYWAEIGVRIGRHVLGATCHAGCGQCDVQAVLAASLVVLAASRVIQDLATGDSGENDLFRFIFRPSTG